MSYYDTKKAVEYAVEEKIKQATEGITMPMLMYKITKQFAIGTKPIKERVELLKEIGAVEEVGGLLLWK